MGNESDCSTTLSVSLEESNLNRQCVKEALQDEIWENGFDSEDNDGDVEALHGRRLRGSGRA